MSTGTSTTTTTGTTTGTITPTTTGHRPHVAVVDRPVAGGGTVPSLVFPELVEGTYALMPKGTDDVRLTVDIRGGEVSTATWPV